MALIPPSDLGATVQSEHAANLTWTNGETYDAVHVDRRVAGGSWAECANLSGSATQYQDNQLEDGTEYEWRVYGFKEWPEPEYSDYSNTASCITYLHDPTGMSGTCLSPTSIKIWWNDNAQNEANYILQRAIGYYGSFSDYQTLGANVEEYIDTDLTPGTWYKYRVRATNALTSSGYSNEIALWTADPPNAPSNLQGQATGTTTAHLGWQGNSTNETSFRIFYYPPGGPWSEWGFVGANVIEANITGLTSNTAYSFKVKARNDSGDSDYSNQIDIVTFAGVAQPTNLTVTVLSGTAVFLRFQDNSELEDDHRVEEKVGAGSFAEIATLPANVFGYRRTGLSAGASYTYRVRAKQGAVYSSYSSEVQVTTMTVPGQVTNLQINASGTEYLADTEMRLTWDAIAGAVGYKVEKSLNGSTFTEIAKIDVNGYLVRGLSPSTQYWFKIRAYNAQGDGSYSSTQTQTTTAYYSWSKIELALRNPRVRLVYRCRVNPLMELSGFTLTGGKTYTYQIAFGEDGAPIDAVYENGAAYVLKTSIAEVEGNALSYYWDYYGRLLYVHTSTGANPASFQILASFWLFFTSWKTKDDRADWGDNNYLGFLKQAEIPDITSEVTPYYEGSATNSFGTLSLMNVKIRGGHYFDGRYKSYIWRNRKVIFDVGLASFSDSEFKPFFTGLISSEESGVSCDDRRFRAQLVDIRTAFSKIVPKHRFTTAEFPSIDSNLVDKPVPRYYGAVTDGRTVCLDATNRIYLFNDGRVKQVDAVKKNDSTLTAGTDYTALQDIGQLVLNKALSWTSSDVITVDFVGCVNGADETINLGADIFKHILKTDIGLMDAEFENDSIARTRIAKTQTLKLMLIQDFDVDDILRTIEHSNNAFIFQDGQGRLGLRPVETTVPSNVPWVRNHNIFDDYAQTAGLIRLGVNIYYDQNPKTEVWKIETKISNVNLWKYRAQKMLDIYTALTSQADVQAMSLEIINLLEKDFISMTTSGLLLFKYGGDVILYSRDRAYNAAGNANQALLVLYSVTKSIAAKKTSIKGELIS